MSKFKSILLCGIVIIIAMLCVGCSSNLSKPGASYISDNQKDLLTIPDNSQYVTLGDYKHAEYSLPVVYDMDDETYNKELQDAIDMEIKTTFSEETKAVERINEPAQEKDTLIITYHGTIDGKPFEGGDSPDDGEEIVLGYSSYPPEFDAAIIGMKKGETKQIKITLPSTTDSTSDNSVSDNSNSTAGKEATYDVTVKKIEYYDIPDLTDEMVQKYTNFNTVDEYMDDLKTGIEDSYQSAVLNQTMNAIMESIVKSSTFTNIPQDRIDALVDEAVTIANDQAKEYNMTVDDYLKSYQGLNSMTEYKERMAERAEEYLKLRMAASEIARHEGIEITQEDVDAYKERIRLYYGLDENADVSSYESDEDIVFECIMDKIQPIVTKDAIKLEPTAMPADVE